jgi:hypothetical protein
MSAETLSDHLAPVLAEPQRLSCEDEHTAELQGLVDTMDNLRAGLYKHLGAEVQPVDLRLGGSAITGRSQRDGYRWYLGPSDTAIAGVERWDTDDALAVRVAVGMEWVPEASQARMLADQQTEKGGARWERRRVERIASLVLAHGGLTVREFDPAVLENPEGQEAIMELVRQNVLHGPKMIPGRTIRLSKEDARVTPVPLVPGEHNAHIETGSAHFIEGLIYRPPNVRAINLSLDRIEVVDGDTSPVRPSKARRAIAHQHAVHARMHELTVVTKALHRATGVIENGRRLRPEGRMMQQAARVALAAT